MLSRLFVQKSGPRK